MPRFPDLAEWRTRLRYRWHADRVHRHHTVESSVMGRGAVLWTATWMIPAAVIQATTQDSSRLLATLGGMTLSVVWAAVLLAGVLASWASRFIDFPDAKVLIEVAGIFAVASAFMAYAAAVLSETGLVGGLFVVTLCWTSSTNMLGRAALLGRQWLEYRRRRSDRERS